MKKTILIVMAIMSIGLTSCGNSVAKEEETTMQQTETLEENKDVNLLDEEKVLFSDTDITIVAVSAKINDKKDCDIKLRIVNDSDGDVEYYNRRFVVNGYTVDSQISGTIYANDIDEPQFTIRNEELELDGIKSIQTIETIITICSNGQNRSIPIRIETKYYGGYDEQYSFDGNTLYDENGIKIKARLTPSSLKKPFAIFIQNATDRDIIIMYEDVALNDQMFVEMYSGPYVMAKSYRVDRTAFEMVDIPDIDKLESVTLKLCIGVYREDGSFSTGDIVEIGKYTIE